MLLGAIYVHAIFDGGMLGFLSVYGVRSGMNIASGHPEIARAESPRSAYREARLRHNGAKSGKRP